MDWSCDDVSSMHFNGGACDRGGRDFDGWAARVGGAQALSHPANSRAGPDRSILRARAVPGHDFFLGQLSSMRER